MDRRKAKVSLGKNANLTLTLTFLEISHRMKIVNKLY